MITVGLVVAVTGAAVMSGALLQAQEGQKVVRSKPIKVCFEYRPDLDRRVGMRIGNEIYVGWLRSDGTFVPDKKSKPVPIASVGRDLNGSFFRAWLEIARLDVINDPLRYRDSGGVVYEYRSGMLIKGSLGLALDPGSFVPDPSSKAITLQDYLNDYDPEKSPRIYNLPGRIVTVIQRK